MGSLPTIASLPILDAELGRGRRDVSFHAAVFCRNKEKAPDRSDALCLFD
jgi:hypothetical protein